MATIRHVTVRRKESAEAHARRWTSYWQSVGTLSGIAFGLALIPALRSVMMPVAVGGMLLWFGYLVFLLAYGIARGAWKPKQGCLRHSPRSEDLDR